MILTAVTGTMNLAFLMFMTLQISIQLLLNINFAILKAIKLHFL